MEGFQVRSRILLVEDEVLIAFEIADALEAEGFEIVGPYQTVSQALEAVLDPNCCDAAVLDANLRNESSHPVASILLARKTPFIVVSGYAASQLPGPLAAGPLMTKPLRTSELAKQLRDLLVESETRVVETQRDQGEPPI